MGKRRKDRVREPSPEIYDDAFRLQEGEYYPEHHEANIKTLCERYPEYSPEDVDAIYRQACRIQHEVEEWVGDAELSEGSRQELLEWLRDHFYGFTERSFLWALERVERKLP